MKRSFSHLQISQFAKSVLFIAALTLASSVSAGQLRMEFDLSDPFATRSKNMTIHFDNRKTGNDKFSRDVSVAVGMFSGSATGVEGTTIDTKTLFTDPDNVLAYCVDIFAALRDSALYTLNEVDPREDAVDEKGLKLNFGRMLSFLGAVNEVQRRVFNFDDDSKNWLRPTNASSSAAIQLGIWESLYEKTAADDETPVTLSVAESDSPNQWFWATTNFGLDSDGGTLLTEAFNLVNTKSTTYSAVDASEVLWAVNTEGQDVIIDPVDVPLPATGFLVLGGIGALAWRRRRH